MALGDPLAGLRLCEEKIQEPRPWTLPPGPHCHLHLLTSLDPSGRPPSLAHPRRGSQSFVPIPTWGSALPATARPQREGRTEASGSVT